MTAYTFPTCTLWRRLRSYCSAAMRCGIELSDDEILGEPDDQVVIHGHLHAFAERPLAPACAPAVGGIAAPSVQPLSRAVLVEQADGDAQRGDWYQNNPGMHTSLTPGKLSTRSRRH